MSVIVFLQVVLRYIFQTGLGWVEEVSVLLMMWTAFVGGSILFYDKSNIAITIVLDKMKGSSLKIMKILFCIVTLIFSFILFKYGIDFARVGLLIKFGGIDIPRFWSYLSIPIGALFVSYFTMVDLIKILFTNGGDS